MPLQLALNLPTPLAAAQSLFLDHGHPATTSRHIAERFGKNHFHVLRTIEKLIADLADHEFSASNFGLSEYKNARGKSLPEYRLTRDGFALLAMSFTGRDALAWKVAFLAAFNAMEAALIANTARFASALDCVRPFLRPVVEATEAGLSRSAIGAPLAKSPAAITYHRGVARRLGLLAS